MAASWPNVFRTTFSPRERLGRIAGERSRGRDRYFSTGPNVRRSLALVRDEVCRRMKLPRDLGAAE